MFKLFSRFRRRRAVAPVPPAVEPAPKPLPRNCYLRWDERGNGWDQDRGRLTKESDGGN